MLRGYLNGLGLPLTLGALVGVPACLAMTWWGEADPARVSLLCTLLVPYAVVFSTWEYLRMHHLLPTFPLLILLLAVPLARLTERRRTVGRVVLICLVVSSGVYTAAGVAQYAVEPRDQAAGWMESNVDEGETVEVYENSIADVAAVHGQRLEHYPYREEDATYDSTLVLNESAYTEWMRASQRRNPEYIQLTAQELRYLDSESPAAKRYPRRADHIKSLMSGETDYTVAAEFGTRQRGDPSLSGLLREGVVPKPPQAEERIVILRAESQNSTAVPTKAGSNPAYVGPTGGVGYPMATLHGYYN